MSDEAGRVNDGKVLTVAATATVLRDLHWASSSLFELFVSWASEVEPERGDVAAWLSATGRHLGEQADEFEDTDAGFGASCRHDQLHCSLFRSRRSSQRHSSDSWFSRAAGDRTACASRPAQSVV